MPQSITEGKHFGEFLANEFDQNYNREVATVSQGQNLVDGEIVQFTGGELVTKSPTLNTEGDFVVPVAGIVFGNHNASATGTNADIPGVVYLARGPAVVAEANIKFPAGAPAKAAAIAALLELGIVVR